GSMRSKPLVSNNLRDQREKLCKAFFDIAVQVNAQHPASAVRKDLKIPACLSLLNDPESICLSRHGTISRVVRSDLQEHAVVATALICLSGRMQESRPDPETGRGVRAAKHLFANRLQMSLVGRTHLDECEQSEVIVLADRIKMGGEERRDAFFRNGIGELARIFGRRKKLEPIVRKKRCLVGQFSAFFVCIS